MWKNYQSGGISPDFLNEEVRNDFLVDVNRKKLWTILIDLYMQFENVCKKHHLTWFVMSVVNGTVNIEGHIFDSPKLKEV